MGGVGEASTNYWSLEVERVQARAQPGEKKRQNPTASSGGWQNWHLPHSQATSFSGSPGHGVDIHPLLLPSESLLPSPSYAYQAASAASSLTQRGLLHPEPCWSRGAHTMKVSWKSCTCSKVATTASSQSFLE